MDRNKAKSILEACQYELSNQTGSEWCRKKYEAIQEATKALGQPEIIYCGECELKIECCRNIRSGGRKDDDFCSCGRRSERRTDESD